MDRPLGHESGRALTFAGPSARSRARIFAAGVGVIALAVVGRTAAVARARMVADADDRAARIAAGYLAVIASADRVDRSPPEMRLLSAAGNLATARFWDGGTQVWLRGIPLLNADTTGRAVAIVAFDVGDSAGAGKVAVWNAISVDRGLPMVAVGSGFAFAALLLVAVAGEFMRIGRTRAAVMAVGLLIVALGLYGQARGVYTTWRQAQDTGLLRARRTLEVTAVGRRLQESEVAAMAGGLVVSPLHADSTRRDTAVVVDTAGAHIAAVAARGQAWRLEAPEGVERYAGQWRRLLGWGVLAMLAGLIAAALPPGGRYLSASRPVPPTPL